MNVHTPDGGGRLGVYEHGRLDTQDVTRMNLEQQRWYQDDSESAAMGDSPLVKGEG